MTKRCCAGWILWVGLLTGCAAPTHLTAGRQQPLVAPQGRISVHLNATSELQFNLRGLGMGISPQTGRQSPGGEQPDPMPWLRYRLHF